jgi:PAS domain S-box-containing protein
MLTEGATQWRNPPVDKSLVTADVYYQLSDSARAYALDRLTEGGELPEAALRHGQYQHNLAGASAAMRHLTGAKERVGRARQSRADLEQQLEACRREIAQTRERLIEVMKQQTATSEILRIISNYPSGVQSMLDAVAENAARLCDANNARIWRLEDNLLRIVAAYGETSATSHCSEGLPVNRYTVTGRATCDRRTIHVHDLAAEDSDYPLGSKHVRDEGFHTTLATPLLREGTPIGIILVRRMEVRPFHDKQIALLETLSDQAVVVIENARLFEAEKQGTLALAHTDRDLVEREAKIRRLVEAQTPQAEDELRAIIDNAPVFLWSDLPDGYCDFLNQRWLNYFNLSLQEAQGPGWAKVLHPDDFAHHLESWQKSVSTGIPFETEARFRRGDGEYRWFLTRAEALRDKTGRIVKWYGTNIDIENLKQTEGRLRQSEAYLAQAQRLSHSGVAAYNETTILYGSEEIYRIWGFDPAQGVPSRDAVFQRIHPDDRDRLRAEVQRAVDEKRGYSTGYRIVLPDGTAKHLETIGQPVFSASGELVEIVTTQIDVTERKRAEQTLRESEGKIRRLVDANILGICIWNLQGAIVEANEAFLHMLQYGREDVVSDRLRWTDLTPAEWRERDERAVAELRSTGTFQPFEKEYFRKDGSRVPVLIGGALFEQSRNEGVAFVLDLTLRKCAEEALQESEAKFRDYAETASDWFWEVGPDYKVTLLTENAFGSYPADRIGTAAWDHALDLETEPEKWRLLRATLDSRKPFRDFVHCSAGRNGSPMYVKASGKPVFDANGEFRGYRGTGADVTASVRAQEEHDRLRQLESDLAHMNRLSIMGELAASLVHEITQPIASARNNARAALNFLAKQLPDLGEVREALGSVVGDADRAGDIIDRIRDHIKKAPPRKDRLDLNEAIAEVIVLAGSAITKHGVSVRTDLAEGLSRVQGDRVQLQQVVLNLTLNAVEAMSSVEAGARELLISTEQSQMGSVLVAVRDSGPGIDPEHLERVFEAFYTTKSSGVGMGLSICRSIIDAHGGRLWADVNEPRGAVFQFTLPSAEGGLMTSVQEVRQT